MKMTNKEMIAWASKNGKVNLDRLIWIARNQERARVWDYMKRLSEMECDVAKLESYPQISEKNKKMAPQ